MMIIYPGVIIQESTLLFRSTCFRTHPGILEMKQHSLPWISQSYVAGIVVPFGIGCVRDEDLIEPTIL